jgi:hypothetical protein
MLKLPCVQLRLCSILRFPCASLHCDFDSCPKGPSPKVPIHVLYSRNIVKSHFLGPSEVEGPQQLASENPLQFLGSSNARIPRLTAFAAKSTQWPPYTDHFPTALAPFGYVSPPLAFLISHSRASHTTLVVALFSRVVLHVPINIMILTWTVNNNW